MAFLKLEKCILTIGGIIHKIKIIYNERLGDKMKVVIQRVEQASVSVDGLCIGEIEKGLLILLGVGSEDTKELVEKYFKKIIKLRIFSDENNKTNLSLLEVGGEMLVVSQFTLYADCKKGNRPSFINGASPDKAIELYEYFLELAREELGQVESGSFGADMKVELVNDGPFTILLDDNTIKH